MRLTKAAEYALRALRFLASTKEDRWISIQEIAGAEEIPPQFLAKVMQRLTQAGFVQSACGKTGGYRLARPATDVSIADVVVAMEGPISVNTCMMFPEECSFFRECRMHPVWREMQAAMLAVLEKYSIADVTFRRPPGRKRKQARKSAVSAD